MANAGHKHKSVIFTVFFAFLGLTHFSQVLAHNDRNPYIKQNRTLQQKWLAVSDYAQRKEWSTVVDLIQAILDHEAVYFELGDQLVSSHSLANGYLNQINSDGMEYYLLKNEGNAQEFFKELTENLTNGEKVLDTQLAHKILERYKFTPAGKKVQRALAAYYFSHGRFDYGAHLYKDFAARKNITDKERLMAQYYQALGLAASGELEQSEFMYSNLVKALKAKELSGITLSRVRVSSTGGEHESGSVDKTLSLEEMRSIHRSYMEKGKLDPAVSVEFLDVMISTFLGPWNEQKLWAQNRLDQISYNQMVKLSTSDTIPQQLRKKISLYLELTRQDYIGHPSRYRGLQIDQGQVVVSMTSAGKAIVRQNYEAIHEYDLLTKKHAKLLENIPLNSYSASSSKDEKFIFVNTKDHEPLLWNREKNQVSKNFIQLKYGIHDIRFSSVNTAVIVQAKHWQGPTREVILFDLINMKTLKKWDVTDVNTVEISDDGTLLLFTKSTGEVHVMQTSDGKIIEKVPTNGNGYLNNLLLSSDNKKMLMANYGGVHVYDFTTKKFSTYKVPESKGVHVGAFLKGCEFVVIGSTDVNHPMAQVFELKTGSLIREFLLTSYQSVSGNYFKSGRDETSLSYMTDGRQVVYVDLKGLLHNRSVHILPTLATEGDSAENQQHKDLTNLKSFEAF